LVRPVGVPTGARIRDIRAIDHGKRKPRRPDIDKVRLPAFDDGAYPEFSLSASAIWRQSRTTAVETRVCQDCIVGSLTIAGVVSSCPLTTGMLLRNSISTFYGHSSRPMM
jgi:hypothetical protein